MVEETIFSKIIRKEIPADIVYQDELVTAFRDIAPQAKTHILIIPNKLIPTANEVTEQDEASLGRLFTVAAKLAKQEGIAEDGYRLIVNCNKHGGQEVFHIHMHLLGGEPLGKMLGK
ncbi:purine nucleoside phosphoramidase [Rodentibacter caecimuris]|uniref:purine nucleoside phosphoramidase n=1 Tax=Rodentibacter caecimuris TaxID=1796644 RepID=UPI00098616B8|nr:MULTISPECIES: purine nucleoside phosphoramidase [Pasteurellaceae]MCR1836912.1 purine nucleoside phosphoramidase [Pasteurella caecimuris]MCU0107245.1 purine nucleoside phosphoramidase [Pasteurella caecimuris]OOF81535.1 histidine triad nucleotide-binding protein [Rodentibacter heylii]QIA76585.1 purine nucleoside phosphoramidase [Rodentibacter heylii]TGY48809.1 purine nucleoside phosphoramidase [Pasteurella caecimuris]